MPTTVRAGDILFNNGTSQTTAFTGSIAWTSVSGRPTDLSSFTNGPGYMNAASGGDSGFGNATPRVVSAFLSKSGTSAVLSVGTACNCVCDCG